MKLCSQLIGNSKVDFVINKIKKQSKPQAMDLVNAYNFICSKKFELTGDILERIDYAYIMCKYMDPNADDVIVMLLYRGYIKHTVTQNILMEKICDIKERYEHYYSYLVDISRNLKGPEDKTQDEIIRCYIMMRVCDKMFRRLMKNINQAKISNAPAITAAYNMARAEHYWNQRQTGEPAIVHHLRVAGVLADFGVESSVIATALLHDVVGTPSCTIEDISQHFGKRIAQYVDAVKSLDREYVLSQIPTQYACNPADVDAKSYKDFIRRLSGNNGMISALYIKAADRIQTLRAIDFVPNVTDPEATEEIQLDYLPLFKKIPLRYFVHEIENLMWRANDIPRYTKMQARYNSMVAQNWEALDGFMSSLLKLEHKINSYENLLDGKGYNVKIEKKMLLPYDIYKCIKKAEMPLADPSQQIVKRIVPLCDVDIIATPKDEHATAEAFVSYFVKAFEVKIAPTGRIITNFENDSDGNAVFHIEDRYRNTFRCRIIMRKDYEQQKYGMYIDKMPDDLDNMAEPSEQITVKLRNGKEISMPKGSTVIDVAFAIHEEIGFTAKSATVNDQKVPINRVLLDGDRIIIDADTCRENNFTSKFIPHVRLKWLRWVVTNEARNKIIACLSDWYEGDDPSTEREAQTIVVGMIADKYVRELHLRP